MELNPGEPISFINPCGSTLCKWTAVDGRHIPCSRQFKNQKQHSPDSLPSGQSVRWCQNFIFPHRMKVRTRSLECGENTFFPFGFRSPGGVGGEAAGSTVPAVSPGVDLGFFCRKSSTKVFFIQNQIGDFRSGGSPATRQLPASHLLLTSLISPQSLRLSGLASSTVPKSAPGRKQGQVHGEPWVLVRSMVGGRPSS